MASAAAAALQPQLTPTCRDGAFVRGNAAPALGSWTIRVVPPGVAGAIDGLLQRVADTGVSAEALRASTQLATHYGIKAWVDSAVPAAATWAVELLR
jgi:hypothetical protein